MKTKKIVIFASLVSGISLIFSGVAGSSIYAAEEVSEQLETDSDEICSQGKEDAEESDAQINDTEVETSEFEIDKEDKESVKGESEKESLSENNEENIDNLDEENVGSQEFDNNDTTEMNKETETNSDEKNIGDNDTETVGESETAEGESRDEQDTEYWIEDVESGQVEKIWKSGKMLTSLQMPQKFDIVVDPWEMDGRTQIYSEEYSIKNSGKVAGTLKLTGIACEAGENVNIQADSVGIHNGNDKNIFIELVIDGDKKIVLSPEGTEFEIELEQNESIRLEFTGAVNENASEGWRDSDIKITVIYDWQIADKEKGTEEESEEEYSVSETMSEEDTEYETKTEEEHSVSEIMSEEDTEYETKIEEESLVSETISEEESSDSDTATREESSNSEQTAEEESSDNEVMTEEERSEIETSEEEENSGSETMIGEEYSSDLETNNMIEQ